MITATYSPEDNKLRLYRSSSLDPETYKRIKSAGFVLDHKRDLFVAPMWTPEREDLLLELCGEIGDEDTSLVQRAEAKAERLESAVRMWETPEYWKQRAACALAHAKYKKLPAVRHRRIKGLEADKRTLTRVIEAAKKIYPAVITNCERWIAHIDNRITYERIMLGE